MAATRRLAAVLAADLVGYSRLMGLDEEGTLVRLRALRSQLLDPKIAENSGRLVKTTGDGFLVEFNSVIDALRCARDVQMAMAAQHDEAPERRFMLRIGVHQGDIVVEDGDIFGNGVNIAARLEGIAEPGGICVSERVQEDAYGRIDLVFDDMGEQQLKNIARPIRAYRVRLNVAESEDAAAASAEPATPAAAEELPLDDEPAAQPASIPPPEPAGEEAPQLFPLLAPGFELAAAADNAAPSAEELRAAVSGWLDRPVEIIQPPGAWRLLPAAEYCRLGGSSSGTGARLGVDATVGIRAWSSPAPVIVRIGPLDRASFDALLPGSAASRRLCALLRSMLGTGAAFSINPVLAAAERVPAALAEEGHPGWRLGWNTWVGGLPSAANGGSADADEAVFAFTADGGDINAGARSG